MNKGKTKKLSEVELFRLKNNYIRYRLDSTEINVYSFFELVFSRESNGELPFEDKGRANYIEGRYNTICVDLGNLSKKNITDKAVKTKNYIITKELAELDSFMNSDFVIVSPITYIGRNRNSNNARNCYGIAIDLDGVGEKQIKDLIHQMHTGFLPLANLIVNSGHGLHIYYLFEKPISLFPNIKLLLKELKYQLTDKVWNSYTSSIKNKQFQGIFQGFRLPDTKTKFGEKVTAFKIDRPYYTVQELNSYIPDTNKNKLKPVDIESIQNSTYRVNKISLKEAKEKYPEWYERRIVRGEPKGAWHIKRDLYDWWLRKCYSEEVKEGHRYFILLSLSMYALKCNIPKEELYRDAYNLLETMEQLTENENNHFTVGDIEDALQAYKECYRTFPRKDIEKITGINIPANKRNGLKQSQHIKKMNLIRDNITHLDINWRNKNGRPKGSGIKKNIVEDWQLHNPNGTKYQCKKETNLHKNTITKYWKNL